jgi:apolipoprotein N-acyltransferase
MGWWRYRIHALLPALAILPLLAYPPFEWRALAWMGLAPLMLAIRFAPGGIAIWLAAGWGYGALFYAVQYAWLARTLLDLGGVSVFRFVVFSAGGLSFIALFPAVVIAGSRWGWSRLGISPYLSLPLLLALQELLLGVFPFGGAPWGSLAATQTESLAARWLVPLAGAPALVLLLGMVNGGWAFAAQTLSPQALSAQALSPQAVGGHRSRAWLSLAAVGVATLLLAPSWPAGSEGEAPLAAAPRAEFSALLMPGNFKPGVSAKGDTSRLRGFLARTLGYLATPAALSAPAVPAAPSGAGGNTPPLELVIWPESAASGQVEAGTQLMEISHVATAIGADILLGSDSRRRGRDYNSAYLVSGGVPKFLRYDKRRLVPFGEYVPAGFRWFFGDKLTQGESDYLSGAGPPVLGWRGRKLGLAICFESVLPGHMRTAAREGAQLMVVIANDQWLTPAARRQHLWLTALRGLENGLEVLFVSNGGWSAHLADGRIRRAVGPGLENVLAQPVLRQPKTPWARWGYGPPALLLAIYAAGILLLPLVLRRRH